MDNLANLANPANPVSPVSLVILNNLDSPVMLVMVVPLASTGNLVKPVQLPPGLLMVPNRKPVIPEANLPVHTPLDNPTLGNLAKSRVNIQDNQEFVLECLASLECPGSRIMVNPGCLDNLECLANLA